MNGDGSRVYYFHAKEQDSLQYVLRILLIFHFEYSRALVMMILITCFGGYIFFYGKNLIISRTPTSRFLSEKVGKNPRIQVAASNRGFTVPMCC